MCVQRVFIMRMPSIMVHLIGLRMQQQNDNTSTGGITNVSLHTFAECVAATAVIKTIAELTLIN